MKTVFKLLTALAAIAGAVYVILHTATRSLPGQRRFWHPAPAATTPASVFARVKASASAAASASAKVKANASAKLPLRKQQKRLPSKRSSSKRASPLLKRPISLSNPHKSQKTHPFGWVSACLKSIFDKLLWGFTNGKSL